MCSYWLNSVFLFTLRSQCRRGGWALWARRGGVQLCVQADGEQAGARGTSLGLHPQRLPAGLHWGLKSVMDSLVDYCCFESVLMADRVFLCVCVRVQALVFDFGSEVYLWHGQDVSLSRRTVALQLTHQVWAGAYDYSNCRVNPLDPTQCNPGTPLWVHPAGCKAFSHYFTMKTTAYQCDEDALTETVERVLRH